MSAKKAVCSGKPDDRNLGYMDGLAAMANRQPDMKRSEAVPGSGGFCHAEQACSGCGSTCKVLRDAGLRPTRQRMALADLLFGKGDRHISAELLFDEASHAGVPVSLATIYNTLHQFTRAGLLKAISIDSSKTYFDTNTGDHHHFYLEDTEEVVDMPHEGVSIANLPAAPEGMEIASVDVVVRVRRAR